MSDGYVSPGPTREEVDNTPGALVLVFGTDWCGHCRTARVPVATAFADYPGVAHRRVEDGPGRRLGRSFQVRLWPTLIFLANGREVARVVRPTDAGVVRDALAELNAATQSDG